MSTTFQAVFYGVLAGSALAYLAYELIDEVRAQLRSRRIQNLLEALEDSGDLCDCD